MTKANRGYNGYSMSVRATEAYELGEMPLSKWTKGKILARLEEKLAESPDDRPSDPVLAWLPTLPAKYLKIAGLAITSWHHTSKNFNRTDFYDVDFSAMSVPQIITRIWMVGGMDSMLMQDIRRMDSESAQLEAISAWIASQ